MSGQVCVCAKWHLSDRKGVDEYTHKEYSGNEDSAKDEDENEAARYWRYKEDRSICLLRERSLCVEESMHSMASPIFVEYSPSVNSHITENRTAYFRIADHLV